MLLLQAARKLEAHEGLCNVLVTGALVMSLRHSCLQAQADVNGAHGHLRHMVTQSLRARAVCFSGCMVPFGTGLLKELE